MMSYLRMTLPADLRTSPIKSWILVFFSACLFQPVCESAKATDDDVLPSVAIRFSPQPEKQLGSTADQTPHFQKHVMPLLGKLSCNSRHCHGSFQGQGGFQLSLFGYDFKTDHAAITGKSSGQKRRINLGDPQSSLLLMKATEKIDHKGGQRMIPDSWQYKLLQTWIAAGAPKAGKQLKLTELRVEPRVLTWSQLKTSISLKVSAVWSDGTCENVTPLVRLRSNDDSIVDINEDGSIQSVGWGDTHVIVFYDNGVQAIPSRVLSADRPTLPWPKDSATTKIDRIVNQQLRELKITPSPVCSDSEFLRRASIDLTGTLPTPNEVLEFLADKSPDKRRLKIDQLIKRPAFAAWWATKLCDFTGCNPDQQPELGQELAEQWYMWIYQRLLENAPYDKIVEGILTANSRSGGESYTDYAARVSGYFRKDAVSKFQSNPSMPHFWSRRNLDDAEQKGLAVAHSFLGIRLQCAQCHKHPWDRWTQNDFKQFSQLFGSVAYGVGLDAGDSYKAMARKVGLRIRGDQGAPIREEQLVRARRGEVIPWREVYLRPFKTEVSFKLLQDADVRIVPGQDPRQKLMDWLRRKDNPFFARAIVNRIWASCFHAGIIEPADDLNPANPPSNPKLLNWLSEEFVKHDYDLRWLLREITNSSTWQRSCLANKSNRGDQRHFSRAIPRRLPAEVIYDGFKQAVCGTEQHQTVREDLTRRAVGHLSMRMSGTYAMHVFGKPQRASACDCERVNQPSLLQSVFLQNDPLVHLFLEESQWLKEIEKVKRPDREQMNQWIKQSWLRCVARLPTEQETKRALKHVAAAKNTREGMEDLLWSLLNTREFLLNH